MPIKKLGIKKYQIRVTTYINGKKYDSKYTGIFETKGAVYAKENELKEKLKERKFYEESEALRYTWKKALNDYLKYSEENHRLSTFYNRLKILEKYTQVWNSKDLDKICRPDVRELVEAIPMTVSFKKEVLKYIRQVFEHAIDNRKTHSNPATKLILKDDKSYREKANHLTAMTKSEVVKVLSYMKDINHPFFDIFYITYQLGLRSSEAIALQYADIVFEKNHVVVSKSWCKKKKDFVPPKNGTSRIVPLNTQLAAHLKEMKLKSTVADDFVLPRINAWTNGGATKILHKIQDELGIKQTNYHSLRASFITHLLRDGLDIIRVQAMVGHRELKTTQRYIRLDGTDLEGVTSTLELNLEPAGRVLEFKNSSKNGTTDTPEKD